MKNKKTMKTKATMIKEFQANIKDWVWNGDKKAVEYDETVEVHTKDQKDLRKILSLFKAGNQKEAGELAYNLDTVVRDVIPTDLYDIVVGNVKNPFRSKPKPKKQTGYHFLKLQVRIGEYVYNDLSVHKGKFDKEDYAQSYIGQHPGEYDEDENCYYFDFGAIAVSIVNCREISEKEYKILKEFL